MSLGTLSLLPPELLEHIATFLKLEYEEWIQCRRVSREFVSWIREVRVPTGRIVRFSALSSTIRRIDGPLLVTSPEELLRASSQLHGDLELWFPGALDFRRGCDCYDFCLEEEIGKGLQIPDLALSCLQVMRERALRYPDSQIWIRISRLLHLRWKAQEGVLYLPVHTIPNYEMYHKIRESGGSTPLRDDLREALQTFFREVPLIHLTYLELVIIDAGHILPSLNTDITRFILNPEGPLRSLRSLGDTFQYRTLPSSINLPSVTELRFSTFEDRDYNGAPYTYNLPDLGRYLVEEETGRYRGLEQQLREITGGYLIFGSYMAPLPTLLSLPSRFPRVCRWKLLLHLSEDPEDAEGRAEILLFQAASPEELEKALSSILNDPSRKYRDLSGILRIVEKFRTFWNRWHTDRELELYSLP